MAAEINHQAWGQGDLGMGQDLPRGAPIGMSIFCLCFASTIEILGYPILTHTHLLFCFGPTQ
jgi:hypothetical protein